MYALSTGGFQCQCWLGYTGDGVSSCTASPAVNDLPSQYVTEATQGPLICDVMYPIDAPGSAYDPTLIAGLTMNPQVVSYSPWIQQSRHKAVHLEEVCFWTCEQLTGLDWCWSTAGSKGNLHCRLYCCCLSVITIDGSQCSVLHINLGLLLV